jgi:hypothetical protein
VLLPLVLASLLSLPSDQPIAPVPPDAPTGRAIGRVFAAGSYIVYGETSVNLHEVTAEGVRRLATFPGTPDAVTLAGETLLILFHTDQSASQLVSYHPAFGLGAPALARSGAPGAAMDAIGERVALFFEDGAQVELRDVHGGVIRTGLSASTATVESVAVAAGANSFLFVWLEGSSLYARALITDGMVLSPPVLVAQDARRPAVSSDGRRFLVIWQAEEAIAARRIADDGQLLGETFTVAARLDNSSSPAVSWNGARHTVVFQDEREEIVRVDVSRNGVPGEREVVAADGSRLAPAVDGSLIAWIERTDCDSGRRVMALQPGGEPVLASAGEPVRYAPQTVAFGETFATVWLDRTDVLRTRLRIGDRIVELSDRAVPATPAIATNGDRLLVAWSEYDTVCNRYLATAIVNANGEILAQRGLDTSWPYFAAASNGSDFVIVWTESLFAAQMRLVAVQLDAGGGVTLFPRVVAQESASRFSGTIWMYPSIVWAGGEYLAVWQRSAGTGVRLQRLSRYLDPVESVRNLTDKGVPFPDVAATMDATLIVINDDEAVRGYLLNRAGIILGEPVIATENQTFSRPAVAARGAEFLVVAGSEVVRVGIDGSIGRMAPLPGDATKQYAEPLSDRAVAASGSRALIAYERGGEIYLRTLLFPKVRSARH